MKLEVLEAFCVAFWVRGQAFSGSCIGGCILNFTDTLRRPSTLFADTRCWNHVFCVRRSFDQHSLLHSQPAMNSERQKGCVFPNVAAATIANFWFWEQVHFKIFKAVQLISVAWYLKMCSSSSPFGTKIHLVAAMSGGRVLSDGQASHTDLPMLWDLQIHQVYPQFVILAVHSNASWFDLEARRHQDTPRWYSRFIHPHWQVSWQKMYLILFNWFWLFVFGCFFVHSFVVFGMLLTSLLYVAVTWNNLHWDLQWDVQVWFSRLRAGRLLLGFPPLRCPRRR